MGEYILVSGVHVKIGTCEDLERTTYEALSKLYQAGKLAHADNNCTPEQYLKPNNFRFRFSWPDENTAELYTGTDLRRGLKLDLSTARLSACACGKVHASLTIYAQKPKHGALYTIIDYPCGTAYAIDFETAVTIYYATIDKYRSSPFIVECLDRMLVGYFTNILDFTELQEKSRVKPCKFYVIDGKRERFNLAQVFPAVHPIANITVQMKKWQALGYLIRVVKNKHGDLHMYTWRKES